MKALVLVEVGKVELREIPKPKIERDELLIETGASTICTTDLNDIRENAFGIELPVVMGHEAAGTVVEVGEDVAGIAVGDRVAAHPVEPCLECPVCRSGLTYLCQSVGHFASNLQGTFAEYFPVRFDRVRRLPDALDFAQGAMMEPVCCCLQGLAQARLSAGDSLLIIGDGPFGVLTARLARDIDLAKVVVAGHHDSRLDFADQAVRLNTRDVDDALAAMMAETDDEGYDAVFLAVGSKRAVAEGLKLLRPKGRLVVFSAIPTETPVDLFAVHLRELEIVGAVRAADPILDLAVEKLTDRDLALEELRTVCRWRSMSGRSGWRSTPARRR